MMFGLKSYIRLGVVVLIISLVTGIYLYHRNLQKQLQAKDDRIERLLVNNSKLETALNTSEDTISYLEEEYDNANSELEFIYEEFEDIRNQRRTIEEKLARHNLGKLALEKPTLIENIINNASDDALRCIELLSGAPENERELNAKTDLEYNNECGYLRNFK